LGDPGFHTDQQRRLGAIIFGASILVALVIVALRLLIGRDEAPVPAPSDAGGPVVVLLTPIDPVPASPAPMAATPAATPAPALVPTQPPVAQDAGAKPFAGRVVCLDPGHGGADLGNVLVEDDRIVLREKDFTLAHALELGRRLEAQGVTVVLTRTTDTEANPTNADVNGDGEVAAPGGEAKSDQLDDLQARVLACNQAGAELLVSIHYNGAENEFLEGYEVWYNDDRPFSDLSARFASIMHEELGAAYAAAGYDAFDKGIGIEDHAVTGPARPGKLTPSEMPGAVVEGLFLSNAEDAAFIQTPAATEAIVGAYEKAIERYLQETAA
jgi:N-acetylmuramoyl-L-alanine amidase